MSASATIYPTSDTANSATSWDDATYWSDVDDTNDTDYVQAGDSGDFRCACGDMPAALGIDSVTVTIVSKRVAAGLTDEQARPYLYTSATQYNGTYANLEATFTANSYTWTTNPSTSLPWTQAQVNALEIGWQYTVTGGLSAQVSQLRAVIAYTPLPASVLTSRHLASVDLHLKRLPASFGAFQGNLDVLNVGMLGAVELEHTAGTHATGLGWEDEVWQRRPFAVHGLSIDMNAMSVSARIKDQRPLRVLVRDLAWSDKASGALGDGIARFATPGAVFTHTRASEHTFTNPVGESEIAATDIPAYGDGGLYMLPASGGRAAPRYYVTNNTGERTLSAEQGSFQCEVNLATVSAGVQYVAAVIHDANNYWILYWRGADGRWQFDIAVAGTVRSATFTTTPSTATWYQLGCYWTGTNGENGETARTMALYVDRVRGTDDVASGVMTEAASCVLDIGQSAGSGHLDGQIRKIHSYQDVLTDTEMMRTL